MPPVVFSDPSTGYVKKTGSRSTLTDMRDIKLYAQILGLQLPWKVADVALDNEEKEVTILVKAQGRTFPCPRCGRKCSRYDHKARKWRHLDTCQYKTTLKAEIPRVECEEHGVLQIKVPWAEPGSRFTALFEAVAIDWLLEANLNAASRRLGLSWDEMAGIQERAVRRGLQRRKKIKVEYIGVDETSFQKRHEYVTVVTDIDTGTVLHVADGHKKGALDAFYAQLAPADLESIKGVAMDMWMPYISSTMEHVPQGGEKIAFDKFHVAQHLGNAVDRVRRQEHKGLKGIGDETLTRTRYLWLQNPENMSQSAWGRLKELKESSLKTARAWAIKEFAMSLWSYVKRGWARLAWKNWLSWAIRSQLEPIKKVARMIKEHLEGILNAITLNLTNALNESINSKIQKVKRSACGFRNRDRFRMAIYFHLGGLDLYPEGSGFTHYKS